MKAGALHDRQLKRATALSELVGQGFQVHPKVVGIEKPQAYLSLSRDWLQLAFVRSVRSSLQPIFRRAACTCPHFGTPARAFFRALRVTYMEVCPEEPAFSSSSGHCAVSLRSKPPVLGTEPRALRALKPPKLPSLSLSLSLRRRIFRGASCPWPGARPSCQHPEPRKGGLSRLFAPRAPRAKGPFEWPPPS